LLIDNLGLQNNDEKRDKIFAHFSMFGLTGSVFGGIIATGLAFYWLKSIWLAASFFNFFLFFLFLFFIQENFKPDIIKENKFKEFLKTAKNNFKLIIKNRIIILLIVINAVFVFLTAVYGLVYPILFKQNIHLPDYYFGFLGVLSAVMGIIGIFFAQRLTRRKNYFFTLGRLSLMLSVLFLLLGFKSAFWWSVIIFSLIELAINGWYPVYQSLFNKFTPDQNRAGILSTNSTFSLLFIGLGELITGLALNFIKPGNILILITPLLLMLMVLIFKLYKEKKPETE
jgi:predicted MFS family arabinose efflux permease